MNPLSRIAGLAVDRMLGLPGAATPYVVRPDVRVPMPDGVVLLGDHYRPPGRPAAAGGADPLAVRPRGPAGVVFAAPLARRGFQVFIQSTRGTFGSGGQFRPFTARAGGRPGHGGLAARAAVVRRPGVDDRGQLPGHTQWAVAPYADPPLTRCR